MDAHTDFSRSGSSRFVLPACNLSRRGFLAVAGGSALAAMSLLAGCGGGTSSGGSTGADGLIKVSFGSSLWPSCMLYRLAAEKGIAKKNGLDLEIKKFSSSTETNTAMVSGQLDFANYPSPDTIAPFTQGATFKVVLLNDESNGAEGIVAKPEIKTVADLKGKTIATQLYSADHMLLLTLLKDNGMSADDVNIVDMTIEASSNAFIAGKCDAASVWDPYFSEAKAKGGTELYSTADNPNLITDCLVAKGDLVKSNPKAVQAMCQSYLDAIAWWQDNKEEADAYMAEELGTTPDDFEAQMATLKLPTVESAQKAFEKADDYTYWAYTQNNIRDFLYSLKQIDSKPDCAEMIDDTFVKGLKA